MSVSCSMYLKRLSCLFVFCTLAVVGWNGLVDPYGIYGAPVIHGFNHYKYLMTGNRERMVKAHQIERLKPDGLILGTSRADWGLDPAHPRLLDRAEGPFNAGLGGGTMYEAFLYLRHAHAVSPLKFVVLSLDVEMFNTTLFREEGFERRLKVDSDGGVNWLCPFADRLATLFSQDALEGSRKTRRASRKHKEVRFGEMSARGSAFQEGLIPAEKRVEAFLERRQEGWRNFRNLGKQRSLVSLRMEWLDRFFVFCHEEGVEVVLMISPYHAALLHHFVASGHWDTFEWWKRELVGLNEEVAKQYGRQAYPLWDFSGYHFVSRDSAPTEAKPIMKYYVECSHYRKRVGDWMLSTALGGEVVKEGFGVLLNGAVIDDVLAAQGGVLPELD